MSTNAHSTYRSFAEIGDENHVLIHVLPTDNSQKNGPPSWQQYMHDLDDFFIRLYLYHQKSGFVCLICGQLLELWQIIFSVLLPLFFLHCIDYDILFKNKTPPNSSLTNKVHIYDIVLPLSSITLPTIELIAIALACIFWTWKLFKFIHSFFVNMAIRQFYKQVLHINDCSTLTWQDVQAKLISTKHSCMMQEVQPTELDVHNRILRHANYMIALINRGMLPIYYRVPFVGEITYCTQGFLYNCQLLFFRGPFKCIFEENWKLNDSVKTPSQRQVSAKMLANNCVKLAIINLLLSPVILIWQFLYFFYSNAALVKRDPTMLFGARNWSLYARWFCRHFNELDHQLNDRLNHGYKSANKYMNAFTSPFLEIVARHIMFASGSILAVLVGLTIYDEDVITVEHVITIMTGLTFVAAIAHAFIPPEVPQKFTKNELHDEIIKHIHYIPHNYPPFTPQARASMANLFQYKLVRLLEDLASTILTPYILLQHLRPKALDIVDFFRNFTVEISNTGDVCVFSMMNIKENGNPQWQLEPNSKPDDHDDTIQPYRSEEKTRDIGPRNDPQPENRNQVRSTVQSQQPSSSAAPMTRSLISSNYVHMASSDVNRAGSFGGNAGQIYELESINSMRHPISSQTEHGKLELSLIHFKLQNPSWRPFSSSQKEFIDQVTSRTIEEVNQHPTMGAPSGNTLYNSGDPRASGSISPRPLQRIADIDSSTAVSLSTMFLHEHVRSPLHSTINSRCERSNIRSPSTSRHQTENEPLLFKSRDADL